LVSSTPWVAIDFNARSSTTLSFFSFPKISDDSDNREEALFSGTESLAADIEAFGMTFCG
jgi:hypothetical protein